jgi:RNA polymerase sigma-70 factor (ECF subfamily)
LTRHSSMSEVELIRACAQGNDTAAWDEFVRRFHRPISLSVLRTAHQWGEAPPQLVDDLVQETYLKLCANKCGLLVRFADQHPSVVLGYIKTIAINVAHDHFKSTHAQKRGSGQAGEQVEDVQPPASEDSLGGQGAIERHVVLKEIQKCLERCAAGPERERDCALFWLYYQQGLSAKAIAKLPTIGLTAKGVESALLRLTRLVRQCMVGSSVLSDGPMPGGKGLRP